MHKTEAEQTASMWLNDPLMTGTKSPVPNIRHTTLCHPERTSFWRSSVTLLWGGHPSISRSLLHSADTGGGCGGAGGAGGRLQTSFTQALLLKHSCPSNRFSHSGTTKYRHRWGLPSAPVLRGTIFNPEVPGRGLNHRPYHEKKKNQATRTLTGSGCIHWRHIIDHFLTATTP